MSNRVFYPLIALLLIVLVLVADVTDKHVHKVRNDAVIDPCALVLDESGQRCR
jgi:hypothetical protein